MPSKKTDGPKRLYEGEYIYDKAYKAIDKYITNDSQKKLLHDRIKLNILCTCKEINYDSLIGCNLCIENETYKGENGNIVCCEICHNEKSINELFEYLHSDEVMDYTLCNECEEYYCCDHLVNGGYFNKHDFENNRCLECACVSNIDYKILKKKYNEIKINYKITKDIA